jgi:hypothetical protein
VHSKLFYFGISSDVDKSVDQHQLASERNEEDKVKRAMAEMDALPVHMINLVGVLAAG